MHSHLQGIGTKPQLDQQEKSKKRQLKCCVRFPFPPFFSVGLFFKIILLFWYSSIQPRQQTINHTGVFGLWRVGVLWNLASLTRLSTLSSLRDWGSIGFGVFLGQGPWPMMRSSNREPNFDSPSNQILGGCHPTCPIFFPPS